LTSAYQFRTCGRPKVMAGDWLTVTGVTPDLRGVFRLRVTTDLGEASGTQYFRAVCGHDKFTRIWAGKLQCRDLQLWPHPDD
jgi:hypothetical protein